MVSIWLYQLLGLGVVAGVLEAFFQITEAVVQFPKESAWRRNVSTRQSGRNTAVFPRGHGLIWQRAEL